MAEQPQHVSFAPDLFRLDGRVALVTGGAGLLGRRYCEALLQAGARVVIGDLDGQRAEAVAGELEPRDNVVGAALDVTQPESIHETVRNAIERFQRLDVLVN